VIEHPGDRRYSITNFELQTLSDRLSRIEDDFMVANSRKEMGGLSSLGARVLTYGLVTCSR